MNESLNKIETVERGIQFSHIPSFTNDSHCEDEAVRERFNELQFISDHEIVNFLVFSAKHTVTSDQ